MCEWGDGGAIVLSASNKHVILPYSRDSECIKFSGVFCTSISHFQLLYDVLCTSAENTENCSLFSLSLFSGVSSLFKIKLERMFS